MSAPVDLMPLECRIRLGQRSRRRGWALSYVGVTTAVVLVSLGLEVREQSKRSAVAALQKQVDFSVEQRRKADVLTAAIESFELALEQHDTLALPLSVSTAISTLAAATPESVTFTSLSMVPKLVRDRAAKPGEPGTESRWLVFELRGLAPSDTDLAQLVGAIESSVLFTNASVDYTTQTEVYGVTAREFGVTCEIELERRFLIVEADAQ